MIGAVARKLFGSANERRIRSYQPRSTRSTRSKKTSRSSPTISCGSAPPTSRADQRGQPRFDDILIRPSHTVREAAKRTIGQRHFDVQLIGA